VREAGGEELYREQQKKAKTEVPEARRQKRLYENERNKRVREAGGQELYRDQQKKAKTEALLQLPEALRQLRLFWRLNPKP